MFAKNTAPVTLFGHTYDHHHDSELQNQLKCTRESLKGLSKAHLDKWLLNSRRLRFNHHHHNALAYLMYDEALSPDSAIDEIIGLSVEQARVIPSLYKLGLRGDDLRQWKGIKNDSFFSKEHSTTLIYLMDEMKLSKEQAMQEIDQLSSFQANILKRYHHRGLQGAALRNWRPDSGELEFGYIHHSAMIALIEEAKLKPDQALNEMHLLSEPQIEALLFGAKHGLRRTHLENWCSLNASREFSVIDAVRLVELIEIQHVDPENAVRTLP